MAVRESWEWIDTQNNVVPAPRRAKRQEIPPGADALHSYALALFINLQIIDMVVTLIGIQDQNIVEGNGLVSDLLSTNPELVVLGKLVVLPAVYIGTMFVIRNLIHSHRELHRFAYAPFYFLTCMDVLYMGVLLHNVSIIASQR